MSNQPLTVCLKENFAELGSTEKRDVDNISNATTTKAEKVEVTERYVTDNDIAKSFALKKFIFDEDRSDIMARFKGKTVSVIQYRSVDPDALIASIQLRNCEYVILEVPQDTSLALFEKIMSFLHQIRTDNSGYNTGITNGDSVITCTCIVTEGIIKC